MRHFFKIGDGIDVIPLLMAINRHPELWTRHTFRQTVKANSETTCILLRYQNASQEALYGYNLAEPSNYEAVSLGLECYDMEEYLYLPEARALVSAVMNRVLGERLGRVLLAKLPPGARVYPHDDAGLYVDYYTRIVIPILAEPGNWSRIGDERHVMLPGEAWIYNYAVEHEAKNESDEDRIHLFIDVRMPSGRYIKELPS